MRYLWMVLLLGVPGVLHWDEAPSWDRMGDSKVWRIRRCLLRGGAEVRLEGSVLFFAAWAVTKAETLRSGQGGLGTGCTLGFSSSHSNDGICVKHRLSEQITAEQQPKLHFIPLLIAF